MQARFKIFRSTWATWTSLLESASEFATEIGPKMLIGISHSQDQQDSVVVVWYWSDEVPPKPEEMNGPNCRN